MIDAEERGMLLQELKELERRGQSWHSHSAGFLYVGGMLAFFAIASLFSGAGELGAAGAGLCAMIALGCFMYHRSRSREDADEYERIRKIRQTLEANPRRTA